MAIKHLRYSVFKASGIMVLLALLQLSAAAVAQEKKHLPAEDYKLWGTLELTSLSSKGSYISYKIRHENEKDTVFVMDIHTKRSWAFPGGSTGKFMGDTRFLCTMPGNEVKLLLMDSQKNKVLHKSSRYDIVPVSSNIVTFDKTFGVESMMTVRDANGTVLDSIPGVTEHRLNPAGDILLYATSPAAGSKLGLIKFNPYSNTVLQSGKTYGTLAWQKNGCSLACITSQAKQDSLTEVFLYSIRTGKQKWFAIPSEKNPKHIISDQGLRISDDGKAVFFGVSQVKKETVERSANVEVWKGEDRVLYPVLQDMKEWKKSSNIAVWNPSENLYRQFTADSTSFALLSGDQQYAITSCSESYGPYFSFYPQGNFYSTELRTGKTIQFLKGQSSDPALLSVAPTARILLYYREGNWWSYDMKKDIHRNLTGHLSTQWDNGDIPADHHFSPHGVAGWSYCGTYVLLYDSNDIWKINIVTGKSERISRGKENKSVVRIARFEFQKNVITNYNDRRLPLYDLEKELLFEVKNEDCESGYAVWNQKEGSSIMVLNKSIADQCIRSDNGSYAYCEQTFESPPAILFRDSKKGKSKVLFSSNSQHTKYLWGRSELVHYNAPDGTPLKAALFYPAGYEKDKKYPMVVEVYQIRSSYLHQYENPSLENPIGFNTANYTLDGYFVLLPDITYIPGKTGVSASECVTAAVVAAGKVDMIDTEKVGLIGHSFGGYETNFIVTHSSIFAAAVSGAGVADPVEFSFTIGKDTDAAQIWRFESQQFRMRTSFFADKQAYLRNSPLYNADKIKAPLLLWCGANDPTIQKEESIILYNALRRLGKKHRMLIYPDEFHFLMQPENKADLTLRVKQWFDHYLKGKNPEKWISDK
ncbi:Prolyl oligopeptidase family protein [Flavobacterium sp. fv08]|nr:Prolyl oligopeptidase family protein [Flavobacterium sp. fv08]